MFFIVDCYRFLLLTALFSFDVFFVSLLRCRRRSLLPPSSLCNLA